MARIPSELNSFIINSSPQCVGDNFVGHFVDLMKIAFNQKKKTILYCNICTLFNDFCKQYQINCDI